MRFLCLDKPSLGITYPSFAGVSKFKSRATREIADWPAVSEVLSNVSLI